MNATIAAARPSSCPCGGVGVMRLIAATGLGTLPVKAFVACPAEHGAGDMPTVPVLDEHTVGAA